MLLVLACLHEATGQEVSERAEEKGLAGIRRAIGAKALAEAAEHLHVRGVWQRIPGGTTAGQASNATRPKVRF